MNLVELHSDILFIIIGIICKKEKKPIEDKFEIIFVTGFGDKIHSWKVIRNYLSLKNTCKFFFNFIQDKKLSIIHYEFIEDSLLFHSFIGREYSGYCRKSRNEKNIINNKISECEEKSRKIFKRIL